MSLNIKICGVVILYNPAEDIIENINSYINQIDHLFIIDNSAEISLSVRDYFKSNIKVEYFFNNNNIGVAKALNIGAEKAILKDYHYLLTMDQDSNAKPNMIFDMLSIIENVNDVGIVAPFHVNKYFSKTPSDERYSEILFTMTSGNLLNLKIYKSVGKFREDYFIDYVDIEYCLRLKKTGYKVIQVNNSKLMHNEASIIKRKFFFITFYSYNHNPLRFYYKIRNLLYLKDEYASQYPSLFKHETKKYFKEIFKILLYEQFKIKKIKFMIKGIFAYRKKIIGKLTE